METIAAITAAPVALDTESRAPTDATPMACVPMAPLI